MLVRSGSWPATRPGVRRMPMPIVLPTITARPKPTPRMRIRPLDAGGREVCASMMLQVRRLARLQRDEDHVDRAADVSRRMARAERLELDVAARPAIHYGLAIRRVLDLAAGEMHHDRVGAVRVEALARTDLHPRADHRDAIVLEHRLEA